ARAIGRLFGLHVAEAFFAVALYRGEAAGWRGTSTCSHLLTVGGRRRLSTKVTLSDGTVGSMDVDAVVLLIRRGNPPQLIGCPARPNPSHRCSRRRKLLVGVRAGSDGMPASA